MSESNNNSKKDDWQNREVGALWLKKSASGNKYLSGHITTGNEEGIEESRERVIVFANKNKKNDNAPGYRIYKSEPQQVKENTNTDSTKAAANEEDDLDVL